MSEVSFIIQGAQVLEDPSCQSSDVKRADILVEAGVVKEIGYPLKLAEGVSRLFDASGLLAMPGLINAHFHSPGNLLKGSLPGLPLEIFMLYEVPPLAQEIPNPSVTRVCTLLGAAEMLKNGVTSVMDDAYHVPCVTRENIDAMAQAYADIGMRATVAIDQPNKLEYEKYPYLEDLLPDDIKNRMRTLPRQSARDLLDLYEHLFSKWHGSHNGRIRAAVSCSAPQRVTDDYMQGLNALSLERGVPYNMHILETKLQRVFGDEVLGMSLVKFAHARGILHEHSVVIHAIWVDDDDIDLLASTGVTIAHNPICNMRLGSGVAPYHKWLDAGISVCLGTDEALSDDRINMFDVLKMTSLVHTLRQSNWDLWPTPHRVFDHALRGGARALGLQDIGLLREGFQADIVLLDLKGTALNPLNNLQRQLVLCEDGRSVKHVFVAGQQVVSDGKLTLVDEDALRVDASHIREQQSQIASTSQAKNLEPFYRQMLAKAQTRFDRSHFEF